MSEFLLMLDDDFVIDGASPPIDVSPLLAGSGLPPTHPIGFHLGSIAPTTGEFVKGSVDGRDIKTLVASAAGPWLLNWQMFVVLSGSAGWNTPNGAVALFDRWARWWAATVDGWVRLFQ